MVPSIKNYFFHRHMVDFVNKIELVDQKYPNNGNVRVENYKRKFLFTMKDFAPFCKDFQSMYFISIIFLKIRLMESVFHYLKFLTFATKLILHKNN